MKCPLCDSRKAKRPCPARNGFLCARCCGEKRVLEIRCPEICPYLIAGRERASGDFGRVLRSQDARQQEKSQRVLTEHRDVIAHLEYAIAQLRLASRDLSDSDVSRAVEMLLDTYRTEDRGVLYEKDSDDLRVESVRRELKEILESYRNPGGKEGTVDPSHDRLRLQSAIECLELIGFTADAYARSRGSAGSYVDSLARMTSRRESKSSIIMP